MGKEKDLNDSDASSNTEEELEQLLNNKKSQSNAGVKYIGYGKPP